MKNFLLDLASIDLINVTQLVCVSSSNSCARHSLPLSSQAVTPSQIVPYDAYESFTENFDLSILASDNPYSSTNFGSSTNTALPTITTTPPPAADLLPTTMPIKIENSQQWDSYNNHAYSNQLQVTVPQYGSNGMYSYPSPQSTNSSMSYENQFSVFPPSPTPSIGSGDYQQSSTYGMHYNFKQEPSSGSLLPPSPPESNGATSPSAQFYMDQVKVEPQDYPMVDNSVPLEDCVDIEEYFRGIRPESMFRPIESAPSVELGATDSKDHVLLRECLQDTSFQRRHNLKPVALESLFGGWESRGDIEPVISLAIEQARRDVEDTCATLNISPGKNILKNPINRELRDRFYITGRNHLERKGIGSNIITDSAFVEDGFITVEWLSLYVCLRIYLCLAHFFVFATEFPTLL